MKAKREGPAPLEAATTEGCPFSNAHTLGEHRIAISLGQSSTSSGQIVLMERIQCQRSILAKEAMVEMSVRCWFGHKWDESTHTCTRCKKTKCQVGLHDWEEFEVEQISPTITEEFTGNPSTVSIGTETWCDREITYECTRCGATKTEVVRWGRETFYT